MTQTPVIKASVISALAAIAILTTPVGSFAQGAGGASSGSAAGSPNAGSAGAGPAAVNGVPSGPANAGGLNNSGNDPSGVGNAAKVASPPAPGTDSAGTANLSGPALNSGAGVTTGSAPGGTAATGPMESGDAAIRAEDKAIDRKLNSICRGC